MIDRPGIYKWIRLEKYHGGPGVSNSILTKIGTRSPAHVKYMLENPSEPTDPQRVGEAFHTLALEPEFFRDRFHIFEGDLRSKAQKEKWQEMEDKGLIVIREAQLENVEGMVKAVREHEDAEALLDRMGAVYENSHYWIDKRTGVLCKVRPDIKIKRSDMRLVLDLKSCRGGANRDAKTWARQIADYRYHVQAAFYLEGVSISENLRYVDFGWITVESEAPYGVNVFMADENMIEEGRILYRKNLNYYVDCATQGIWPGYEEGVKTVSLPEWARSGQIHYKGDAEDE